jgi:coenzyme F420 hydrogenase subunit beta
MSKIDVSKLSIAFSNKELCTRSGTCIGVCPTNAIKVGKDFYPELDEEKCIECGLCAKTCPGGQVNFKTLSKITFNKNEINENFDGNVQKTYVGYASDKRMRQGGAGGGVITGLLWHLLKNKIVDGCIVTRMDPQKPWLGQVFIARTYEELIESQQSKYTIIPVNSILEQIRDSKEKYAIAALPCQVHGLRMLQKEKPSFANNIYAIIGLFCASALEPYVSTEMMSCRGIKKEDIQNFEFRGGDWPGKIRVKLKTGVFKNLHYSNFKDGAINYLTYLYSPFRCQTCIDGSAEFSDISVSDAWTRNSKGKYLFESQSKLLARTDKGIEVLENAIKLQDLVAKDVSQNQHFKTHRLHTKKKGLNAPVRTARLKSKGKSAPTYDKTVNADLTDKLMERLESAAMFLGRYKPIRYPLFKFLTSSWGIPIIKLRQYRKSKKYR